MSSTISTSRAARHDVDRARGDHRGPLARPRPPRIPLLPALPKAVAPRQVARLREIFSRQAAGARRRGRDRRRPGRPVVRVGARAVRLPRRRLRAARGDRRRRAHLRRRRQDAVALRRRPPLHDPVARAGAAARGGRGGAAGAGAQAGRGERRVRAHLARRRRAARGEGREAARGRPGGALPGARGGGAQLLPPRRERAAALRAVGGVVGAADGRAPRPPRLAAHADVAEVGLQDHARRAQRAHPGRRRAHRSSAR